MKKNYFGLPFIIAAILLSTVTTTTKLSAQVTIGSEIPPTRAALLDLKTKQEATVNGPIHPNNATSTSGGLLLPRVTLVSTNTMEPFIPTTDAEWMDAAKGPILKARLTGLMVYNLTNDPPSLYPGVWTWDGTHWVTSGVNAASILVVRTQPKPFTFYETGWETAVPLTFTVSGGTGSLSHQWYRITSNNVHVRVAEKITANAWGTNYNTDSFTPGTNVLKGTTRNANNTGFYRFYCVAKDETTGDSLISDIAEVAVGCGGKTKEGKWLSFMCFNLGADTLTIAGQKAYPIGQFTNSTVQATLHLHTYIPNEEKLYGDLFQWGRIADGHEKRQSDTARISSLPVAKIEDGGYCSVNDTQRRPRKQIKPTSTEWYGKFLYASSSATNYDWNPAVSAPVNGSAQQLWADSGRDMANDPCTHYKVDGTYHPFWHADGMNPGDATCSDAGTGWKITNLNEWLELYRGGTFAGGQYIFAEANSMNWYSGTPTNYSRGAEIKPDNETTTLFIPASGIRNSGPTLLYEQGTSGYYYTSTVTGIYAYHMSFNSGGMGTQYNTRAHGRTIRCIKP
jgi:hypothetical protein